jgi:hypothetical protein
MGEIFKFDPANFTLETLVGASGLTLGKMITMYKQAPNKGKQLRALCELSGMEEEQIKALLLAHGVSPMQLPRKGKKAVETPTTAEDRNMPADVKEAFERVTAAINDLADLIDKYVEAQAAALRKLQRIKELLDREGVHRDEP